MVGWLGWELCCIRGLNFFFFFFFFFVASCSRQPPWPVSQQRCLKKQRGGLRLVLVTVDQRRGLRLCARVWAKLGAAICRSSRATWDSLNMFERLKRMDRLVSLTDWVLSCSQSVVVGGSREGGCVGGGEVYKFFPASRRTSKLWLIISLWLKQIIVGARLDLVACG